MSEEIIPQKQEITGRNPDGTFMPGVSGNPGGRPRNTMKDYVKRMFVAMNDEEKRAWLKSNKVSPDLIWQMAEGRPKQSVDGGEDSEGNPLPILGGITKDVSTNNSPTENTGA